MLSQAFGPHSIKNVWDVFFCFFFFKFLYLWHFEYLRYVSHGMRDEDEVWNVLK